MNFDLSDTDKKLVAAVEKVVADSGYPRKAAAEDTAAAGDSIRSAAAMLAACGYLTSGIDAGGDTAVGRMAAMETLAALDNRHFLPLEMSVRVAARLIDSFGSAEQKERHLAGLLAGSTIGALALSEETMNVVNDPLASTATASGEDYVLEGTKNQVVNADCADLFVVAANLEGEPAAFLLERDAAGLTVQPGSLLPGGDIARCGTLHLDGCRVPAGAVIRAGGKQVLVDVLRVWENEVLAARAVGLMQASLSEAHLFAKEHVTGKKPLIAYQEVAFKLAEMLTLTQTARLMAYKSAWLTAAGDRESTVFNACAKVFCTEAAEQVSSDALSVLSAKGLSNESPSQAAYQQVKYTQVAGTSPEIARVMIGDAEM